MPIIVNVHKTHRRYYIIIYHFLKKFNTLIKKLFRKYEQCFTQILNNLHNRERRAKQKHFCQSSDKSAHITFSPDNLGDSLFLAFVFLFLLLDRSLLGGLVLEELFFLYALLVGILGVHLSTLVIVRLDNVLSHNGIAVEADNEAEERERPENYDKQ